MSRFGLYFLITFIVTTLVSCASPAPKLTDEEILAEVEKYNQAVPEEKQLVCTREKIMGSLIPQVTCRTKAQVAQEKQNVDDHMDRAKRQGDNTLEALRQRESGN